MDLFKKIIQAGQELLKPPYSNPGLNQEFFDLLVKYLGQIAEVDPELSNALIRFVVDDSDGESVLRLQGNLAAAGKLGYYSGHHGYGTKEYNLTVIGVENRNKIFQFSAKVPVAVWVRFGQVLAAAKTVAGGWNVRVPQNWPGWLVHLLMETPQNSTRFNFDDQLEEILVMAQLPKDQFVAEVLSGNSRHIHKCGIFGAAFQSPAGVKNYFARHQSAVKQYFCDGKLAVEDRVYALQILKFIEFDCNEMIDPLVEMGTATAKQIREAAWPVLEKNAQAARLPLEKILREGDASQRQEVVRVMHKLYGAECKSVFESQLQADKSERVKQIIRDLLATDDVASAGAAPIELPPMQLELGEFKLPAELKGKVSLCYESDYHNQFKFYQQQLEQWNAPNRPRWMQAPKLPYQVTAKDIDRLLLFVESGAGLEESRTIFSLRHASLADLVKLPGLKLIHLVRLMYALQLLRFGIGYSNSVMITDTLLLEGFRNAAQPPFGLREVDAAVANLPGRQQGQMGWAYLVNNSRWNSFCDWEPDAVWPLFAEQLDLLKKALQPLAGVYDYGASERRGNVFKVIAMFPQVPVEFMTTLWELALGETKAERYPAQLALNTVPGRTQRVIATLADGRQNIRAAAAEWLGKIGDKSAVEPLKAAFLKEKSEVAKGVIMLALDALHADVDEFLDRDKLLQEAKAGVAKKLPKGAEWLPLDSLPRLQWSDSGKQVDATIVKWWVVQCIQQKSPSCGPLLKRYLSMCRSLDATNLSKFMLSAWIGRETASLSAEDASVKAQEETDRMWNAWAKNSSHYKSKDDLYQQLFNNHQNTCLYSAIEQKGMLALVSAHGDGDCVKMCEKYIRHYYGTKTAQCKALIEVLSWIENPLALQTMLAIANRFRTKSIKEMARENVQAIADRQGWTIDELSDRTIPDGGFARPVNEEGEPIGDRAILELDFGPRQFEVRLNDELEPVIFAAGESKSVKALPAPGKNDNEELAKEAKKEFSDSKKVVKEVVKRQTERLYEAMCTQRSWRFSDWKTYLVAHPIVGRLCVRLVWAAFSDSDRSQFVGCLRPLEDGSLTNENDESVTLADDAVIVLAHTCNTSAQVAAAWQKHLQDYDVTPLFLQFGRQAYVLPGEKQKATELSDFEGHMLTTFKLRGKANKLGFLRGEVEDGGCFYRYMKAFASLSLQAVLEFTGSFVPEEDQPAGLTQLYFEVMPQGDKQNYWNAPKMPLGKVPAVLLSECYNDWKQIAAEGSGYDPEWKKKGLF